MLNHYIHNPQLQQESKHIANKRDEITTITNAPDQKTRSGGRDYNLLLTLYNTGARVSEITRLQRQDVDLQRQHAVHLHGKGRKERIIPLWHQTVTMIFPRIYRHLT